MATYIFEIPGKPVGKGRPRFTRAGHTYTPDKTVEYENLVRLYFTNKYPDMIPYDGPVVMSIYAFFPIPESWSKRKAEQAMKCLITPGKPDCDNIAKIICDSLNGIAYKDDAQVWSCQVVKKYDDRAYTVVVIDTREATE